MHDYFILEHFLGVVLKRIGSCGPEVSGYHVHRIVDIYRDLAFSLEPALLSRQLYALEYLSPYKFRGSERVNAVKLFYQWSRRKLCQSRGQLWRPAFGPFS